MKTLEKIRVPAMLVVVLSFVVMLSAPLCPVQVSVTEWSSCNPPVQTCVSESEHLELQPPILVVASGFSWRAAASSPNSGTNHTFSAQPAVTLVFFLLPLIPTIAMMLRPSVADPNGKDLKRWSHFILTRRYWRGVLWGVGLCLLLLSAFWAWGYLIFYAGLASTATVDPLLTSTIGTFLLMGVGFTTMMLSVRSRAIWPVISERDE